MPLIRYIFVYLFLYNVVFICSEEASLAVESDGTVTASTPLSTTTTSRKSSSSSTSTTTSFDKSQLPNAPSTFEELLKHGKFLQSLDPLAAVAWYNATVRDMFSLSSSSIKKKSKKSQSSNSLSTFLNPPINQAIFLEQYADLLGLVKQYKSAVQARYQALDIKRTNKLSLSVSDAITTYASLAIDLQNNGDYKLAINILQKAQTLAELDNASKSILLRMESSAYECNGQLDNAYSTLLKAKQLQHTIITPSDITQVLQEYDLIRGIYSVERHTGILPSNINKEKLAEHKQTLETILLQSNKYNQQLDQLPHEYISNLRIQPFMNYTDKLWWNTILEPVANILKAATKDLAQEYLILKENKKLYNETECIHNPQLSYWSWYATNGYWVPKDNNGCSLDTPIACKVLEDIKHLNIQNLNIMRTSYSIIGPNSHLRPHCGMTNAQLKFHLGLIIPKHTDTNLPCSYIRVKNEIKYWEEGKILFFDDSFEHEVWNNCTNSNQERVILQFVFLHPDYTNTQQLKQQQLLSDLNGH